MSFADVVIADRRLMILRVLAETAGYGANRALIQTFLETGGHTVSADRLDADIAWLAELALVTLKDQAVLLTQRGGDVAMGRATVPGVRRLRPGE